MKGKIDDTNATFLSRWLTVRGIRVWLRENVADTLADIVAAFESAASFDLGIATGGLGPTTDDLTREALAAHVGKKLAFDPVLWKQIESYISKRWVKAAGSNKRQAFTIPGAEALKNENGTAPGMWYVHEGKYFVLLPGPPLENQPMIRKALGEKLIQYDLLGGEPAAEVLRCYQIGESALADMLEDAGFQSETGYYFSQDCFVELHFSNFAGIDAGDLDLVKADGEKARRILKEHDVFFTKDAPLSKLLLDCLIAQKLTISFAESITGGQMAGEFVKNPGASKALVGGIIAYSNELKEKLLGVSSETLIRSGAVSQDTVSEMAYGLRKTTGADVCISVSGIAGPDGGSDAKPIGIVHFGFLVRDKYFHLKEIFAGTRERIIKRAIVFAFVEVLRQLAGWGPGKQ
ncbi:MAG: nicotinamide-nucleotide amidohydrolase family protein [Spirochaetaceae bacterium]|nr:MAG: nicotinamide-nucleotide amidohydrolase family protein [Spirochaetaceae bacterium]